MAIHLEFIDLIIPIANIDRVYPGGFAQYKIDNAEAFGGRLWHDDFLFRDGAMDALSMEHMVKEWEQRGLKGAVEKDGRLHWQDLCVVEGLFQGPTLPCDWLEFDRDNLCVFMKGKPRGEIMGPRRR